MFVLSVLKINQIIKHHNLLVNYMGSQNPGFTTVEDIGTEKIFYIKGVFIETV